MKKRIIPVSMLECERAIRQMRKVDICRIVLTSEGVRFRGATESEDGELMSFPSYILQHDETDRWQWTGRSLALFFIEEFHLQCEMSDEPSQYDVKVTQ